MTEEEGGGEGNLGVLKKANAPTGAIRGGVQGFFAS